MSYNNFTSIRKAPYTVVKCIDSNIALTKLTPTLELILTQSLDTGIIPADFSVTNITLVYKKGDHNLACKYIVILYH